MPIDYWDYLGWKDTLASPGIRPGSVPMREVRGDREVYTPQIVVNGATHVLGSDPRRDRARHCGDRPQHGGHVGAGRPVGERRRFERQHQPALKDHGGGEVWLCPLARAVPVEIGRGENHGRTVTYHNVVRRWLKLGDFGGTQSAWNIPLSDFQGDDIDAVAVMVQQGTREKPGIVLGAALAPIARQTGQVR